MHYYSVHTEKAEGSKVDHTSQICIDLDIVDTALSVHLEVA